MVLKPANRFVGKNTLEKVVSLLKEFNDVLDEDEGFVDLTIEKGGNGYLKNCTRADPTGTPFFTFKNLAELQKFLEGSQLTRLIMVSDQEIPY